MVNIESWQRLRLLALAIGLDMCTPSLGDPVLLSGGCADAVFALGTDSGLRISDLPDSNHCKFAFWSPFNTIIRSFLGEAKKNHMISKSDLA